MISDRPRWADHWPQLARVAARAAQAREGREDYSAWRAIAADWQFVISHRRPDAPAIPAEARIAAIASAVTRARAALAKAGVDYGSLQTTGRDALEGAIGLMVIKVEALDTLLWHERQIRFGRPMVLFLSHINIMLGARSAEQREAA
jgi:hypothetical protein